MYAGLGQARGMGFDWGGLVRSVGDVITGIVGGGPKVPYQYPPIQNTQPRTTGMDLTTLALIGVGTFLLVKAMNKR
jgi:hypothetical protein